MTTLRLVASGKYALVLFGILLGVTVLGGAGLALGLALSVPEATALLDDGSPEYAELAGGAVLALLGFVVLSVGYLAAAYKLLADATTAGVENAEAPFDVTVDANGTGASADGESARPVARTETDSTRTRTGPSPGEQSAKRHGAGRTVSAARREAETADRSAPTGDATAEADRTSTAGGEGSAPSGGPPSGTSETDADLAADRPTSGDGDGEGDVQADADVGHAESAAEDGNRSSPGIDPADSEPPAADDRTDAGESADSAGSDGDAATGSSGFQYGTAGDASAGDAESSAGDAHGRSGETDDPADAAGGDGRSDDRPLGSRPEPSAEEIVFGDDESDGADAGDEESDRAGVGDGTDFGGESPATDDVASSETDVDEPDLAGSGGEDPLADRTDDE